LIIISIVSSFSGDISSFDAYGLKLAANDILLVESLPSDLSFLVRLAPFNSPLSCTIPYNDSNEYISGVSVNRQSRSNDSIRFVFIGVNRVTDVPLIGSLTYTGVRGAEYVTRINSSENGVFPCDGWEVSNYRIHQFEQFTNGDVDENSNNDFFVVTVA
jgi:hypothetical protein